MNIASKGLTGDIGASVVESQNMAENVEQQAENELADMGYTFQILETKELLQTQVSYITCNTYSTTNTS